MKKIDLKFSFCACATPGKTLDEQCAMIAASGCQGVEAIVFKDTNFDAWQAEITRVAGNHHLDPNMVILGGLALNEPGEASWVKEALEAIKGIGASALLTPEYRAIDPIPLFPPFPEAPQAEQEQVMQAIEDISSHARQLKVGVVFEPILQFMTRFWYTTDKPLEIVQRLENPYVGLALDFCVMNITDVSIPGSILKSGQWVHHIHLADNNRLLPGQGHIDFKEGFKALQTLGYDGWFSFECVASQEDKFVEETKASITFLVEQWSNSN